MLHQRYIGHHECDLRPLGGGPIVSAVDRQQESLAAGGGRRPLQFLAVEMLLAYDLWPLGGGQGSLL